jgi:RNA polymerase sigma-70 factor (ECF subfamily)
MGETPNAPDRIRVFVDHSYGKVVAAVALATGDPSAAEDGVQDALLKVLRDGHEPDSLAAWVTVVATNEVRQAQRRRSTEQRAVQGSVELSRDTTEGIAVATDVRSAISELPERQREIVLLYYYVDASVADTAAAMGISEGTVKTQLHRARAKLANALGLAEEESA